MIVEAWRDLTVPSELQEAAVAHGEAIVQGRDRFHLQAPKADELERWIRKIGAGVWENNVISLLSSSLVAGDVFLDVGANVGFYSLLAASRVGPTGRVVALEPDPGVLPYLTKTLTRNSADVEVYPIAIASQRGDMPFSASSDKRSRLAASGNIRVSADSLDNVCRQLNIAPTVVKVDIEGGEACFWPMAPNVLKRARLVVMEIHPASILQQDKELSQLLELFAPYRILQQKSDRSFHIAFGSGSQETVVTI